jgi:hypothetical protein
VSIGPGTVSDDGTVITSNAGVGIVKAGWHCDGSPQAAGSPNACPDCTDCTGDECANRSLCKMCNNTPSDACDGQGHCDTGLQLLPQICPRVGIVSANQQPTTCSSISAAAATGATCGAAMTIDYTKVTISDCGALDVAGTTWHETVTSDLGCQGPQGEQPATGTCDVRGGNVIVFNEPARPVCEDMYYLCFPPGNFPQIPYACTETYTQQIVPVYRTGRGCSVT